MKLRGTAWDKHSVGVDFEKRFLNRTKLLFHLELFIPNNLFPHNKNLTLH